MIRFWSVDGASHASPATLTIHDSQADTVLATVVLSGATGPAVPPATPNSDPVASDDVAHALPGNTLTLNALINDYDPDNDILAITDAADPVHGAASVARCVDFVEGYSPHLDCIRYTPDDEFRGVDQIPYTISDGRRGTDTAVYWIAVDHPDMRIDSVVPNEGPPEGGQSVVINGDNFSYGTGVQFVCGGVSHPAPVTSWSLTQISVTAPPMPAGTCDVPCGTSFSQASRLPRWPMATQLGTAEAIGACRRLQRHTQPDHVRPGDRLRRVGLERHARPRRSPPTHGTSATARPTAASRSATPTRPSASTPPR